MFWTIAVGVNWLCAYIVFSRHDPRLLRTGSGRMWAGVVVASLVTAMPGTGAVWLVVAAYLDYHPLG